MQRAPPLTQDTVGADLQRGGCVITVIIDLFGRRCNPQLHDRPLVARAGLHRAPSATVAAAPPERRALALLPEHPGQPGAGRVKPRGALAGTRGYRSGSEPPQAVAACRSARPRRPTRFRRHPAAAPASSTSRSRATHLHPHHLNPHAGRPQGTCRRQWKAAAGCLRRCVEHVCNHLPRSRPSRRDRRQYRLGVDALRRHLQHRSPARTAAVPLYMLYSNIYNNGRIGARRRLPQPAEAQTRSSMVRAQGNRPPARSVRRSLENSIADFEGACRHRAPDHGDPGDCRQYGSPRLPIAALEHGAGDRGAFLINT